MWELSSFSEAAMASLRYDSDTEVIPSQPRLSSTAATVQRDVCSSRLQRHAQFNPQAIGLAVEIQFARTPFNNGLHNRQAQTATVAVAVAPETLGHVL